MATGELSPVLRYLHTFGGAAETAAGDGPLLERFHRRGDEAAFAALLRRHGPMVLGVCRRLLRDGHDAEDAFQATFLLLVRRAGSLRQPERLGPWLYGVAYRTALRARARAARRRGRERPVEDLPAPAAPDDLLWRDLRPVLDDAIALLPAKYRAPFVLCYLEGLTNAQAARQLGCPPGTVATRLARARQRLRARLAPKGLAVGAALAATALAPRAAPAVPPALAAGTARAAAALAAGPGAAAGVIPAPVTALMEGVGKAMLMDRVRIVLVALAALTAAGAGVGVLTYRALAGEPAVRRDEGPPVPPAPPAEPTGLPTVRAVPAAPPPVAAPSDPAATYRSANFVVHAPTHRVARLVGEAAEQHRKAQALSWLGKELPPWPEPCPITVALTDSGAGGATSFAFDGGAVREQHMHLEGSLDRLLANTLPHEVTHTVFAHHFGGPVPRWADEGGALLSEDDEEQQRHDKLLRQIVDTPGRAIPLRRLFPMPDYPSDIMALFAEGYSVTRFLVERKDRPTFLAFVRQGMRDDWDGAARRHYGSRDVDDLEQAWLAQVRRDRPWLEGGDPGPHISGRSPFPSSPPPRMAFAVMTANGALLLRMSTTTYVPVQSFVEHDGKQEPQTTYQVRTEDELKWVKPDAVRAFGTDGKPLDRKTLRARLQKEEAPVLVSADGREVDLFHLQLIKEGTVILVLPLGDLQLPPQPAPAVPPVAAPQPPVPAVPRGN